jgi:hypothetical protein
MVTVKFADEVSVMSMALNLLPTLLLIGATYWWVGVGVMMDFTVRCMRLVRGACACVALNLLPTLLLIGATYWWVGVGVTVHSNSNIGLPA